MCELCSNLEHINIPNSVTQIGQGAFYACDSLSHIDIPASVKLIHDYAFWRCHALTDVIIPNGCVVGKGTFPDECNVMTQEEALRSRVLQLAAQSDNTGVEVVG